MNAAGTHNESGLGIRVVRGQNSGYAFTESSMPRDREEAARTASYIADGMTAVKIPARITSLNLPDRYPVQIPWEGISPQDKMPDLYQLNERIFSGDKRVKK